MSEKKAIQSVDLVPLLVRIALAVVFIYHGYGKVFEGGHSFIADMMAEKGAPYPEILGWMAALTEFGGGILILVGFLSRIWGLGLVILMSVAIYTVNGPNGFDLRSETGPGFEYCFALGMMALSIFLGGAGAISLDRLIFGNCCCCRSKKEGDKCS